MEEEKQLGFRGPGNLPPSFFFFTSNFPTIFSLLLACFLSFFFLSFWLCWVFVAAHRLSLVAASWGYSLLQCMGSSLQCLLFCVAQALGARASAVAASRLSSSGARALERRLSSCGAQA